MKHRDAPLAEGTEAGSPFESALEFKAARWRETNRLLFRRALARREPARPVF
jgi:hypothetical protein